MECRWIEDIREFQDIAEEWDNSLFYSQEDNPFLLSDFVITWWKYYRHNRRLMVFCIYENGHIVAGIPLCEERRKFRKTVLHMGGPAANLTHFLLKKPAFDATENLVSSLEKRGNWDIMLLDRVLSTNPIIEDVKNFAAHNSDKIVCDISDAGFDGKIDLTVGYEKILNNLPKRLRRYLKNCKQQLSRIGELELHKITGTSNVIKLFNEYRDLSRKSFKMRNNISAFESATYSNFFRELLVIFSEKAMLDAHKLTVDNFTLGISFGYRFLKGFKWILTAFNPDFRHSRPGHLLIDALVQEAIRNEDPYFDMYYGGGLFYKQQWCNSMIPLKKIEIYRNNVINRTVILTERNLRLNPLFMDALRNARKIINRFIN